MKDIPDQEEIGVREWFDAEDFEDLDLEENWFFSSDIKNIPDKEEDDDNWFDEKDVKDIPLDLTPLLKIQIELEKLGAWARST